jgi:dienelactone hydrolase
LALCLLALAAAAMATAPVAAASRAHRHAAHPVHHRSASAPAATPPAVPPGLRPPFAVETTSVTLFDPTRSTPARGSVPSLPGRRLVTDLFVPSGAPGPLPLVVFAHGWNSNPMVYEPLLAEWAQAGLLVAAPVFPDSTDLYAGSPVSDYADQALDLSFVITSLLHSSPARVDPTRIAVAGHSDGGTDVALLALDPAYADPRVRAIVCMSGELPSGVAPYAVGALRASLLVAVGSNDEYGLSTRTPLVFQEARTSSKAMIVEQGGDHLGSFVDATPAAAAMREETMRFLELALEPRSPTSAAVVGALEPVGSPALTIVPPS